MWRRKAVILREGQLKQAIKDSIQTEKEAMDFYRLASGKMYNERPRLTFKLLSHEEREHARSFYDVYRWDDLPPFEVMMAAPPDPDSPWLKNLKEAMLGEFNEEQALALAMRGEQALEEKLLAIAEQVEDDAVRDVYLRNASMTHRHLEVITKDYNLVQEQDSTF